MYIKNVPGVRDASAPRTPALVVSLIPNPSSLVVVAAVGFETPFFVIVIMWSLAAVVVVYL